MFISDALAETDTITLQNTDVSHVESAPQFNSAWTNLVPMILVFAVFYFLLIRPQEKKRKDQESLVLGVKVGEEIMSTSGIFGKVTKINDSDNTVIVQISKDVEIKMLKTSIADIVSRSKALPEKKSQKLEKKKKIKKD